MLGEDAQAEAFPAEVALAGDDQDAIALEPGLLLEGRGHLAVDRVAQIGQEQAERPGPAGPQAARRGIRDVIELGSRGLDGQPGRLADPWIVREGARCGRARDVHPQGDVLQEHPTAPAVNPVRARAVRWQLRHRA